MFQVFSLLTGDQPCVRFSWKERIESARARTPWTSRGLDIKKKEYYYRLALVLRNASYMLNTCKSNVVFGELKNY